MLRRILLGGFTLRHNREMDELIQARLRSAGRRGAAIVWLREFADLFRVAAASVPARWPSFSWIDVKLGIRLVWQQPVLTAVAVFALGVGIPVGLAPWQFVTAIESPLPVEEGDRVRTLRYWDAASSRRSLPRPYDYVRWQDELTSFAELGAALMTSDNVDGGVVDPVPGARVTASTFELLRVPPLLGRTLDRGDEQAGAEPVVVIGYSLWRSRLGADPAAVGQSIRLNGIEHTVVGVMPAGFRFPIRHELWRPLLLPASTQPGEGGQLLVYGRLASGIQEEAANVELEGTLARYIADFPAAYEGLRAEVLPTAHMGVGMDRGGLRTTPEFALAQSVAIILLFVACANVGMLVFARTSARALELSVRSALGASRSRIVLQVFTESLVLAGIATAGGLVLIDWVPARLLDVANITPLLPYWVDPGLTPTAAGIALVLAILSAVVAGAIPALRLTRPNIRAGLDGGNQRRIGGWTGWLIVGDVACAVVVVALALAIGHMVVDVARSTDGVGIDATEYLAVEVRFPTATSSGESNLDSTAPALLDRLRAEPGVGGVAAASALPRMDHPRRSVEVEGGSPAPLGDRRVRLAVVDVHYFGELRRSILAGRDFQPSDLSDGVTSVIVNTNFVDQVLAGGDPIGRRIRLRASSSAPPTSWHEVVGVVGHLGMHVLQPDEDAGVYLPAAPGAIQPLRIAIDVGPDPGAFTPRLRALTMGIDPAAALRNPRPLSEIYEGDWYVMGGTALGGGLLVLILLALATSSLYAIMSFSVARRTSEIGIRKALGAGKRSIALTVSCQALTQVLVGVTIGLPGAAAVFVAVVDASALPAWWTLAGPLSIGVATTVVVAVVACLKPTLKALHIAPTEALRAE